MKEIILATKNPGKLREIRGIFNDSGFKITSLAEFMDSPDVIEDGTTFEENALKKAHTIYEHFGIPVMSDDSGIAVEQLNWGPGVYSARYAGENASDEDNNRKLIAEVQRYPEPHIAKYICCAVFYDGKEYIMEKGEINGRLTLEGRGHNGFGYDPYFIPDGYNVTMAEIDPEEKNRISHRAQAFIKLKEKIRGRLKE